MGQGAFSGNLETLWESLYPIAAFALMTAPLCIPLGLGLSPLLASDSFRLHSHNINYCTGSKQQQVTCYDGENDDDYWIVKPAGTGDADIGAVVTAGVMIRLEHFTTLLICSSFIGNLLTQWIVNGRRHA